MAPTCVETVFLFIFRSRVCICQALTTSTAATTPTIASKTTTVHSTESPKSTAATTPTIAATTPTTVPTTESPKSTSACHFHADCIGHLCQGNQHPYCKIVLHSSVCHCTVCTEDSHCYCPQGLVGKCHFNYFLRTHNCVCAISPAQTTGNPSTTQTTTIATTETPSSTAQTVITQAPTTLAKSTTGNFTTTPSVTQSTSQLTGVSCPTCNERMECTWKAVCDVTETCMVRWYPGFNFTTHCIQRDDCDLIKLLAKSQGEIFCCENTTCLHNKLGI
ncbi:uncharacterized protein LOC144625411 [Crassostrea virginica]